MKLIELYRALFRKTDPETSEQAAESVPVMRLENLVYEAIKGSMDGLTPEQIENLTGLRSGSVTPRIAPLIRKGYIYDTGERRKASSGRSQRVLKVVM